MPQYAEKFAEHIATHQNELAKREAEAMKKQMMMRGNNNG
jgi:hypothetical protein